PGGHHRVQQGSQQLRARIGLRGGQRLARHQRQHPSFIEPNHAGAAGGAEQTHMTKPQTIEALVGGAYRHGFVTDIESDTVAPGLNEDVVRMISLKKKEPAFLLEWRLKALRHWLTMREPHW